MELKITLAAITISLLGMARSDCLPENQGSSRPEKMTDSETIATRRSILVANYFAAFATPAGDAVLR